MRAEIAPLLASLLIGVACTDPPTPAQPVHLGCIACHGAADDHPSDPIHVGLRCYSCHLGDGLARTAEVAHVGLELEPGALDTVDQTCGQAGCHEEQAARVKGSLMATGRGLVAVDRFAFGEIPVPDGTQTIADVLSTAHPTPAEDHLRRLCTGCHLGTRRDNRDDSVRGAGSGCSACHSARRVAGGAHPPIDGVVPDERCLGCHSRSARISLSYQGLAEVHDGADCPSPVTLFDGRPGCRVTEDVHHASGIACTDCHLHTELMGDGKAHAHQEDAVELRCESCHGPAGAANEATWADVQDPSSVAMLARRRATRLPGERVRRGVRGTPLWNLRSDGGGVWRLLRKADSAPIVVPQTPTDTNHARAGHERLTCGACHSAWTPLCPECHTSFEPDGEQWDFGAAAARPGRWVEAPASFGWGEPPLGVTADGWIVPVVPGMHATIEVDPETGRSVRRRLFARAAPHTTSRLGRTCVSCHRARQDGLAWAPDLPGQGTRVGLRPLTAQERERISRADLTPQD